MGRFFLLFFMLSAALFASGLEYLNALRAEAGLAPFDSHPQLEAAAKNHSRYLQLNDAHGHYETEGRSGFTGVEPWDRTLYAGYPSRLVSENVSVGQKGVEASVDGLFSAIYHRFGFLSLENDEIGIGVSDDAAHFTYDMGNAAVRALCEGQSYEGSGRYYVGVCADENHKVEARALLAAVDAPKENAPALILWPPADARDIPPAFFEESPDPLPDHGVSGYPVSVQFNDAVFEEPPTVESFTLTDEAGEAVEVLTLMDAANDPNAKFSGYEFALFPKKRLEWGTAYRVRLAYTYRGATETKSWCFATRSLKSVAQRVYRVESDNAALEVVSGRTYALYLPPSDGNDTIRSYRYSYNASGVSMRFLDPNTFAVTLTGDAGRYADITFSNGKRVTLTLSGGDTAEAPKEAACTANTEESETTTPSDEGSGTTPPAGTGDEEAGRGDEAAAPAPGTESGGTPPLEVEGGDGVYRPVEGSYVTEDARSRITVQKTADGTMRYEVTRGGVRTLVTLPAESAHAAIDRSRTGTLTTGGVTVTVHPDGTVEVDASGALLPTGRLPAGTRLWLEGRRLEATVPVADTLEFRSRP